MNESKVAYNVAEAARALGVSRPTMYRLLDRPDFPKVRIGRRVIIPCDLFAAWLEEQASRREAVL